jgi:hypothetical protein
MRNRQEAASALRTASSNSASASARARYFFCRVFLPLISLTTLPVASVKTIFHFSKPASEKSAVVVEDTPFSSLRPSAARLRD